MLRLCALALVTIDGAGAQVPAKTPRDIVDKLHRETVKVLQSAKFQGKLAGFGADSMLMRPRRVRRLCQERDRGQRGARQGCRPRAQVS
jgi:tripartite-type tricarboxylate transporter receptor subunit TctC